MPLAVMLVVLAVATVGAAGLLRRMRFSKEVEPVLESALALLCLLGRIEGGGLELGECGRSKPPASRAGDRPESCQLPETEREIAYDFRSARGAVGMLTTSCV